MTEKPVKPPSFKSTYAIVDVCKGRNALAKYLRDNPGLRVTIEAVLTDPYGHDDGMSIEFNCEILSIKAKL